MKHLRITALGIAAALTGTSVSAPLMAAPIGRTAAVMAAGACQPFVPTPDVRYNASGLTNAGATTIYVVCSVAGAPMSTPAETSGDATRLVLAFSNTSTVAKSITCTARPGLTAYGAPTQIASTQSQTTNAPNSILEWTSADFDRTRLPASANFTCALQPGMMVNFLQVEYVEEI